MFSRGAWWVVWAQMVIRSWEPWKPSTSGWDDRTRTGRGRTGGGVLGYAATWGARVQKAQLVPDGRDERTVGRLSFDQTKAESRVYRVATCVTFLRIVCCVERYSR
jgi:hypothetical protein